MKPTGVSLVSAISIVPTYLLFKVCPWMTDLSPAQQSGITMGVSMFVGGWLALMTRFVAVISLWAREVHEKREEKLDGRALCLRMLAQLHGG